MKKVLYITMLICVLCFVNVYALTKVDTYKGAVLIETNTGKILYEYKKDDILPQASTTKLMTYYAFKELLKQNSIKEEDKVVIEVNKFNVPIDGTQIKLKKGDVISIEELINTMLIPSANDSADELQYIYDKNNKNIIQSMNSITKALGLYKSHYVNVTGLTVKNGNFKKYNVTTAYELAKLARVIINKYPEILETTSKKEYKYNGKLFENTNRLLYKTLGVDGLKTGHTNEAGYCLVSTENVTTKIGNGKNTRLLSVVLGCPSEASRVKESIKLLKYGEDNFINDRILNINNSIKIKNEFYQNDYINGIIKNDVYFLRNKADKVTKTIELNRNLPKKISKGDKIGIITINVGNETMQRTLYAQSNFKIKSLFSRILIYIKNFFNNK